MYISIASNSEIIVTWVTFNKTESIVKYGINRLNTLVNGSVTRFTDGGTEKRLLYIHRVELIGLELGVKYRNFRLILDYKINKLQIHLICL